MLSRFLKWWFSQLSGLFGAGEGTRVRDRGDYVSLSLVDRQLHIGRQRSGRFQPMLELTLDESGRLAGLPEAITKIDPARTRCRVILPSEKVLARDLELPLAAEENLTEVLGFEMDRQTPFRANEVYYDYRVLKRDNAGQKIHVSLQVAKRALVDPFIAHLRHWDLTPVHSQAQSAEDDSLILDFEPGGYKRHSSAGFNLFLAIAVLVLITIAIVLPVHDQQQLSTRLETQLDTVRVAAAEAVKVRDLLDDQIKARTVLHEAKNNHPAMVVLLEEITRVMPEDTYLFRFEVRDQAVSLQGSSKAASALISILEQSPYLGNARFASPVTREGKNGRERFHISAKLLNRTASDDDATANPVGESRS
jgi:general secretion pathway protein L